MFLQIFEIPVAYALTSGPSQPEVQSFEPASTTEMVDLFTGDFTYNIPLFELPGPNGGYPFNIAYHAGIGMDQEASWVGLGWSLNPGSITRQMRGLPDDFSGDEVVTTLKMKPSTTVGVGAGAGTEIFGGAGLELNLSVRYNNYKGIGYSIGGDLGFNQAIKQSPTSASLGLGLSLDSQEGLSLTPSMSLGTQNQDHRTSLDLGLGINSRTGLQNISTGISRSRTETIEKTNRKVKVVTASSSSNLSLASVGHTPMVGQAMSNSSLSAKVKAGGTVFGAFGNFSFFGFYNKQKLLNNSIPVANPAYGYLNYEKADDSSLLDFNRERDGIIRKESPNLPVPSLTYDIYSVTGQGIAAMYRPIRNDRGQVYDQFTESVSRGASVGGDVGPGGLAHFGVNLSILNATSKSGKWNSAAKNELTVDFKGAEIDDPYEPYFFKAHGESTIEPLENLRDIGGESAVGLRLGNTSEEVSLTADLDARNANPNPNSPADYNLKQPSTERKIRSQAVSVLTNEELLNGANELLPLFDIADVNGVSIQRTSRPVHHIAGLTALNADGLRYTYALPAYNEVNEEYQLNVVNGDGPNAIPTSLDTISVNDVGDEFYSKTEIPQYAHSYLLTSIVGPDYVDRGTIGLDESDIGYWVKFTYSKSTSQFKWRAPFIDANRIEGYLSDNDDDKASLVYGEKEIWYLAKAETKSHIAEFITSERLDGKGVSDREQTTGTALGASLEKLDEIRLYSRASSSDVIKKVIFNHNVATNDNYELCQNVPNSTAGGKLTLKKLHFEFGSSTRGRLTSYKFEYANNIPYQSHAYDRWGNYKEIPSIGSDVDDTHNIDLPYTDQNPANRGQLDNFSSSWNLSQIELPSGGEILVDYEGDDYGFVQHMPAMQMMEIVDPIPTDPASAEASPSYLLEHDDEGRKIRFKLEQPIPEAELLESPVDHVKRYLDLDRDLYFRVLMNLGKAGVPETDAIKEYVSGYAAIDSDPDKMGLEKVGNQYVYGFFTLKADGDHHPFSKRSWQHIRTNQPELVDVIGDREVEDNLKFFQGLISVIKEVQLLFRGFNKAAEKKDWGEEVYFEKDDHEKGRSRVRLFSPDKIKHGGGHRVKQVTFRDNWNDGGPGIYGQVYQYRTNDDNGEEISSGVAAFEPSIGGEENALRIAKKFSQSVPLHSNNNLFFEYPVNESYYPGPQVGYGKVTVKSLAAAVLAGDEVLHTDFNGPSIFPAPAENVSFGTTGVTVNEFYTAKDFPVITDETEKKNKPFEAHILIPLAGAIDFDYLATSQGYSIVTNDMHGRPLKVSNFRQDDDGQVEEEPISWVRYNYLSNIRTLDGQIVNELNNVFTDNLDGTLSVVDQGVDIETASGLVMMGVEHEFFTDSRFYEDRTLEGGANTNVDVIPIPPFAIPIPIPSVWPNVSKSLTLLKSAVTNKVIFKTGILESIEAYDGGSLVKTRNIKWDAVTGKALLTKVNNNFDDDVFSWTVPAYWEYPGMGGAYQNVGLKFSMNRLIEVPGRPGQHNFSPATQEVSDNLLVAGDELIISQEGLALAKATYIGLVNGTHRIQTETVLPLGDYQGHIWRSGYRNHLSAEAGTVTGLLDPSEPTGPTRFHFKNLLSPFQN